MKKMTMAAVLIAGLTGAGLAAAQAIVGQAAPAFSGIDTAGKTVSLASFKGKYVVLEWVNPDCPFSQKHYNSGNMQATQKHAAAKDVAWLSVNTTGIAQSDPKDVAALAAWAKAKGAAATAILVDEGKIARAYSARTTPHMFLIDPAGKLVYAGAIDSKASSNPADIAGATNYVIQAIDETVAGKPVSKSVTKPYGCSVKYGAAG
ncbi:redoxin domain-containing protein [Massilia cavernae]|uniref:Thioredoxin family protein n=1 Tax=Massilia cavernae TaxID=2320864 RepID=A0A418XPR5_9BURK|nr:redoxin domain-containing protein [Massilia cavernae]RJG14448.1 thioredoxin family protein [Massilia cavernae]